MTRDPIPARFLPPDHDGGPTLCQSEQMPTMFGMREVALSLRRQHEETARGDPEAPLPPPIFICVSTDGRVSIGVGDKKIDALEEAMDLYPQSFMDIAFYLP